MKAETIERKLVQAANRLAKNPPKGNAAESIEHCTAQCNFWRLKTAYAAALGDDKMLRFASERAESWEQRRGQALRHRKADDLARCRELFEQMTTSAAGFESLDA